MGLKPEAAAVERVQKWMAQLPPAFQGWRKQSIPAGELATKGSCNG